MKDRFTHTEEIINRLKLEYQKYGTLIIAFDFDDTIFDYHQRGDTYDRALAALRKSYDLGLSVNCFSRVFDYEDIVFKSKYFSYVLGIELDSEGNKINSSSLALKDDPAELFEEFYNKPQFSILLDDKARLGQALDALEAVLEFIEKDKKTIPEF